MRIGSHGIRIRGTSWQHRIPTASGSTAEQSQKVPSKYLGDREAHQTYRAILKGQNAGREEILVSEQFEVVLNFGTSTSGGASFT